jgi:hypothetical protein
MMTTSSAGPLQAWRASSFTSCFTSAARPADLLRRPWKIARRVGNLLLLSSSLYALAQAILPIDTERSVELLAEAEVFARGNVRVLTILEGVQAQPLSPGGDLRGVADIVFHAVELEWSSRHRLDYSTANLEILVGASLVVRGTSLMLVRRRSHPRPGLGLLSGAAGCFEDALPGVEAVLARSASANVVPDRISGRAWPVPGRRAPNRVLKLDPPARRARRPGRENGAGGVEAGTFRDAVPGAEAVLAVSASANVVPHRTSGRAWRVPGRPAPNRVLKLDPPAPRANGAGVDRSQIQASFKR